MAASRKFLVVFCSVILTSMGAIGASKPSSTPRPTPKPANCSVSVVGFTAPENCPKGRTCQDLTTVNFSKYYADYDQCMSKCLKETKAFCKTHKDMQVKGSIKYETVDGVCAMAKKCK